MIVKTKEGVFKEKEDSLEEDLVKVIDREDIYIIHNFFNEEFLGVFDRDTFTFINTNIKIK